MVKKVISAPLTLNVAVAKQRFSEIVGRVAFAGETVLITRRGRPMAKIVPIAALERERPFAEARGWLENDDPFFATIDDIVASRRSHVPRALGTRATKKSAR